jgi:hypothetical protein
MNDAQKQLHDLFEAYRHTSRYKDDAMIEILTHRAEYEQRLAAYEDTGLTPEQITKLLPIVRTTDDMQRGRPA